MSAHEIHSPLMARTVPSVWVTSQAPVNEGWHDVTLDEPYQRIVGLVTPAGEEIWAPTQVPRDANSSFDAADAAEVALPFTGLQADRIVRYFQSFLSQKTANSMRTDSNCHRFGAWMVGLEEEKYASTNGLPTRIARERY